jgi:hypothetical protein
MKALKILPIIIILVAGAFIANQAKADQGDSVRGHYIYDEADRLKTESELTLSNYLLGIDQRTGYELVLVFPTSKMDDQQIIDWFNQHGVGKKGKDTGAALFVFPDNSWFMAIGSNNDKVTVPYSKTYGDKILKDLGNDFTLSILRYVDAIGKKIDEPGMDKMAVDWVGSNLDLILGWAAVISFIAFLVQQIDGFQWHDFIIPGILMLVFLVFVGANALMVSYSSEHYTDYGIITDTKKDSYMYVTYIMVGKTMVPVYHTVYTNDVRILGYNLKEYGYRFSTTDFSGAWDHNTGEIDSLSIHLKSGSLDGADSINDFSGGKMIGDGAWGGT